MKSPFPIIFANIENSVSAALEKIYLGIDGGLALLVIASFFMPVLTLEGQAGFRNIFVWNDPVLFVYQYLSLTIGLLWLGTSIYLRLHPVPIRFPLNRFFGIALFANAVLMYHEMTLYFSIHSSFTHWARWEPSGLLIIVIALYRCLSHPSFDPKNNEKNGIS